MRMNSSGTRDWKIKQESRRDWNLQATRLSDFFKFLLDGQEVAPCFSLLSRLAQKECGMEGGHRRDGRAQVLAHVVEPFSTQAHNPFGSVQHGFR